MTPEQLRQYADYYESHLDRRPGNVEARLRLATIYREMGRTDASIDAYQEAARLLADRDLPLEAMAACKAVLEMDPQHIDAQFFLARLYAKNPDVFDGAARVARPVEGGAVTPKDDAGGADGERAAAQTVDAGGEQDDAYVDDDTPTIEIEDDEREGFSRSEMEELLTTVDIGPEDIVDVEEIGDIEAFEEKYGEEE